MSEEKELHRIWWDDENKIIRYRQIKDAVINEEMARDYVEKIDNIVKDNPSANRLLLDLINLKNIPTTRARSILFGLGRKYSHFRIAFLSKWTALRVALNFIIRASGHKDTRAFADEAEAIKWLKGSP